MCYLRLYVEGRGCGVPSKSAIFNSVVFFTVVFEQTPPREFAHSASKLVSTLRRCNLRKVVLFPTLRQRAWPWHAVKVGHFEFSGIFFLCLGTNSSQEFCPFCFKIGQYSQKMVLNKRCALCDSTSKGVAVGCHQSWPFLIECQTVMPFVPFPNHNVSYYESPCERPSAVCLPHTAWTATDTNLSRHYPRHTPTDSARSRTQLLGAFIL